MAHLGEQKDIYNLHHASRGFLLFEQCIISNESTDLNVIELQWYLKGTKGMPQKHSPMKTLIFLITKIWLKFHFQIAGILSMLIQILSYIMGTLTCIQTATTKN